MNEKHIITNKDILRNCNIKYTNELFIIETFVRLIQVYILILLLIKTKRSVFVSA